MSSQNEKLIADAVQAELAKRRRKSLWYAGGAGLFAAVLFLLLLILLPAIIANTSLRNRILTKAFPNWKGTIESEAATLWWSSPVRFANIRITSPDGREVVNVPEFETEKTLWQFISDRNELGEVRVSGAKIHVIVQEEGVNLSDLVQRSDPQTLDKPTLALTIANAALTIESKTQDVPPVTLQPLNLRASVDYDAAGQRIWTIDKGKILDNAPVTREVVNAGMKYVTPVLANAAWVEGQFSLDIDECHIPVATPEKSKVSGQLSIHAIQAGAKNELIVEIVGFAGTLLRREVPTQVRLANDSVVDFRLEDERVYHSNLRFGLPEVSTELLVETQGSVGLDQTLDITADIPLPLERLARTELIRSLGNHKLRLAISGSLADPQISLQGALTKTTQSTAQELLKQLTMSKVAPKVEEVTNMLDNLTDVLTPQKETDPTESAEPVETPAEETAEERIAKEAFSIGSKILQNAQKRLQDREAAKDAESDADAEAPKEQSQETQRPKRKGLLRGLLDRLDEPRNP